MKTFEHPTGSIIELIRRDIPHCGVVVDTHRSIELIAFKDEVRQKMICQLVLIDLRRVPNHPVTGKTPTYKLRQHPTYPWSTAQVKDRIKTLKLRYDQTDYHVIYNNCQHFAWELSTGQRQSPDADKFKFVGGAVGLAFRFKDFGINGSSSSASIADLQPLQSSLLEYLASG